jgi:hypothetical protein
MRVYHTLCLRFRNQRIAAVRHELAGHEQLGRQHERSQKNDFKRFSTSTEPACEHTD